MQPRLKLVQDWRHQVQPLLPTVRATRLTPLALFTGGMLWASRVT